MRAKSRGVTVHELLEHDMPKLWADVRAVRQICLNLLGNAIKFTPHGGEIWLKAGWTASGGQYISIKDTVTAAYLPLPQISASFLCGHVGT
jgi:two-component system cell cycle sensor histidine kinase PleC